ncbi:MAG: hypothetical protein GX651_02590, partial [Methanomicrobiales archaeon]|nr:hypothetical protein [Methanomicrobiales archaeon]
LGLLLVIMAIQILAMGETPLGSFRRSWFLVAIGLVFVAMGVYSCIVPGIITDLLRVMLGLLNLVGSLVLLAGRVVPMLLSMQKVPKEPVVLPAPVRNLLITQTALNIIGILFGISMLLPGVIPGLVVAAILFFNGLLLLLLAQILGTLPAPS